jgi:aldose 1-epimerase
MTFQVRVERRPNRFGVDDRAWLLDDGRGSFVEIAPSLGFNCYRWHVPDGELLYADPNYFHENKPTRSGFPILFPFPNRIREGRFTWAGKEYRLPTNDSSGKNAIHGFVCRKPWRVIEQGANDQSAWVTAEFLGSKDAPESLALWPADYRISVTYYFEGAGLEVRALVSNPDSEDLPWGLGYHPYFALTLFGGPEAEVAVRAGQTWDLLDCLPSGRRSPVDAARSAQSGRRYADLQLDDVYTDVDAPVRGLVQAGSLSHGKRRLELSMSSHFREIVGFTPPHRQAICLEPYTCVTDAVNLQQQGVDAGWRVLAPGASETALVKLAYTV